MDQDVKKGIAVVIRILRFILVSALLCVIMSVSYSMYGGKLADILAKLESSNNTMDNMIWLYKHAVNILPCILVVILQALAYIPDKNKCLACRERKWQVFILFLYTYIFVFRNTLNGQELSDLGDSALWFATQLIPLIILALYYSQRQSTVNEPKEAHPDDIVADNREEQIKGK